jgi:hypothetical protein
MTTAYAALDSIIESLQYEYGEGLQDQFDDSEITYNEFEKSTRKPKGLGYVFGLRYARTQSTGGRLESAKLPDPLTGKKDQGKINPAYIYGVIRLTGPAIEAAKGDTASFVDSLADEMEDILQSVKNEANRMAHGDGFGKVGVCSASFAPSTSATYAVTFNNDLGITYLMEGMLGDWFDSTGATASTTCVAQRILHITPSTKVVVFEASGTTYKTNHPNATIAAYTNDTTPIAVSSIFVKMGSRLPAHVTTDTPSDITGLEGIFDDGTLLASFENITVASNPKWAANVMTNNGINRELELDLMLNACDLSRIRSGAKVTDIICGLGQRRKYAGLLMPLVQYAPEQLRGGYTRLTFAGGDGSVTITVDPQAQPNKMYFYPKGDIKKYELTPLGWGNLDGSQMHRRSGYDEWDLFLRLYTNLGCEQRNGLTKIAELVEPSLYVA